MLNGRDVIYLYDGSFEGLLTSVFESYYRHEIPLEILEKDNVQGALFCEYFFIETDMKKAERVSGAVCKKISFEVFKNIYYTYLSDAEHKGKMCLDYVRAGFHFGKSVNSYMYIECVSNVLNTVLRVKNETQKFIEFIRFSEMEGGVYYSEIEPKNNVLPLVVPHFVKRFSNAPWIIHDTKRRMCAVYNGKECYLRDTDIVMNITYSKDEQEYRNLWRQFYNSIEIKERRNERCRIGHMPKRFWKNLTEMNCVNTSCNNILNL